MALRLTSRGRARGSTARGAGALLTVALTTGLAGQVATASADDASSTGAESYLADLVGKVTDAEKDLGSMEGELGGLRESVNKSRVDLDRSAHQAQDAQTKVTDARSRLGGSQDDLDSAQVDLDRIARSAYTQGGDASPLPLAAGSGADDAIDRATYIRMAAERQQSEVDRLDLARTQAANEESQLRAARDTADNLVTSARNAQAEAQRQFDQVQQQVADKAAAHQKLLEQATQARKQLAAARSAVDRVAKNDSAATSFDKRRAAEAAVAKSEASTPAAPTTQAASPAPAATTQASQAQSAPTPASANQPATVTGGISVTNKAESLSQPTSDTTEETGGISEAADTTTEATGTGASTGVSTAATDTAATDTASTAAADASGSFTPDVAGDSRRQAAIDGLVGAAGAAFAAGTGAAVSGGDPLSAASEAARNSASQSYASLPTSGTTGADDGTGTTPTTPVTPGTETGTGTTENTGDTSTPDTSGTVAEQIERVIERGMTQLGVTYAWGGGNWYGPTLGIRDGGVADAYGDYAKVGFDCSGLMMYAFYAAGVQLDHYSGYQYTAGEQVPVDEAQRGDMLFWGAGGSSHVALYLGDGKMLEAPQSGSVVQVSDVRWSGIEPMATRMLG